MSAAAPAHPAQTLNLRCARCSYELRGLDGGGRCPECGIDIADTLEANRRRCGRLLLRARRMHGPPIARSGRRWLRAVAAGLAAVALAHAALVAWYFAWVPDRSYHTSKAPDLQLFAVALLHAAGVWLLTARQRGAHAGDDAKRRTLRRLTRALALAAPAAFGMGLVSELVPFHLHAVWARAALVPLLAVPALVFLTADWLACLAALVRGRRSVVAFQVARLLATVFTAVMVAGGVVSGRRVAEVVADSLEALAALGGIGMACYAAVTPLVLRLTGKYWTAAVARNADAAVPDTVIPTSAARRDLGMG